MKYLFGTGRKWPGIERVKLSELTQKLITLKQFVYFLISS